MTEVEIDEEALFDKRAEWIDKNMAKLTEQYIENTSDDFRGFCYEEAMAVIGEPSKQGEKQ